ncbi:MAG: HAH_0734 family protein [Halobacteriales archaeon]
MKRLIIHGDPGIRKDGIIEYDGKEQVCFSVTRNGDYHGPDEVQLWCVIGTEDERDAFTKREFIPHRLETESIDAEAVTVVKAKGDLAV